MLQGQATQLVWSGERHHRQNTAQSRPVNGSPQQCPTSVDLHTTVINQILQHRKTTTGLKTHSKILEIIFL